MLDPDTRSFYADVLRPPPGYAFDTAVGTTYTLDLATLLTVPLSLVLFHGPNQEEALRDPIAILEALRRTTRRIRVFCQRGRTHAPVRGHSLFPLLEPVVREVVTPNGGAFHPKLWLLRFASPDPAEPPLLRLAILSRNLTADRCWDLSLVLEGRPGGGRRIRNRPVAKLLRHLAGQSGGDPFDFDSLIGDLEKTEWELPGEYEEVTFHVTGLDRKPWLPERSDRLVVISPFVSDGAVRRLAGTTREPVALISRPDELMTLSCEARQAFARVRVLADGAETEDGEEPATDSVEQLHGLHAKAFIAKRGWYTHLYVGSANATDAAMTGGLNVEIMAELKGRASQVKSLDDLLGSDGFGSVLEDFVQPDEGAVVDAEQVAAELALEEARRSLCSSVARLACEGSADSWRLALRTQRPARLDGIASVRIWLVTQLPERAVDGRPLSHGEPVRLGPVARASITGFVAFELTAAAKPVSTRFVLNVPVEGMPSDRDAAVLRSIVSDPASFVRYLMLLLSGLREGEMAGLPLAGQGASGAWSTGAGFDDTPLLEDLTRALCRDPARLRSIQHLVSELRDGEDRAVLPEGFLEMWEVFASAIVTEQR